MEPSSALMKALAVTCELTGGAQFSKDAARVMAESLGRFPEPQVLAALSRCQRELKNRLTLADVIARLDDGRPGPEEAWAMIQHALADERLTVVWTEEMAVASGPARAIIDDRVAARMAFLESYRAAVTDARNRGEPVRWSPCLGWDKSGRDGPLLEAARLGRISVEHADALLVHREEAAPEIARLTAQLAKRLTATAGAKS